MSFNSGYNGFLSGSLIDRSNFRNLFGIIYFDLRNQEEDTKNTLVSLTFRYELNGANNTNYYMAESVFAMQLVNLRSVTCYKDQNFKENAHFGDLNLFTSEKRVKLSYKKSINLEDLDFDFFLQHFKLCLFVNEGDEETNS